MGLLQKYGKWIVGGIGALSALILGVLLLGKRRRKAADEMLEYGDEVEFLDENDDQVQLQTEVETEAASTDVDPAVFAAGAGAGAGAVAVAQLVLSHSSNHPFVIAAIRSTDAGCVRLSGTFGKTSLNNL